MKTLKTLVLGMFLLFSLTGCESAQHDRIAENRSVPQTAAVSAASTESSGALRGPANASAGAPAASRASLPSAEARAGGGGG
ncbi:MAG TPA: hypothetical protein VEZ90_02425, partial [Blastocatellia bacterium]|nr:hypothetical protein [Blastocatellia bacterium]